MRAAQARPRERSRGGTVTAAMRKKKTADRDARILQLDQEQAGTRGKLGRIAQILASEGFAVPSDKRISSIILAVRTSK